MPSQKIGITTSSFASSDPEPLKVMDRLDVEIIDNPYKRKLTENEAIEFLSDKDGLLAGLEPLNRNVLESAKSLKAIARVGIGMDNVDTQAAKEFGIKVSNTPDGPTYAVAEMITTAALAISRGICQSNTKMHNGIWEKTISTSLKNTKMLFIGYGRIGRQAAKMMKTYGVEILVCDPLVKKENLRYNEKLVDLDYGLQNSEIISLNASGNKTILGTNQFKLMKKGVVLLNSARANLVDQDALLGSLNSGKISGAWFDVFWEEPYKGELTNFEQVILTPHISTYTKQCRRDMEMDAVKNLLIDMDISCDF